MKEGQLEDEEKKKRRWRRGELKGGADKIHRDPSSFFLLFFLLAASLTFLSVTPAKSSRGTLVASHLTSCKLAAFDWSLPLTFPPQPTPDL